MMISVCLLKDAEHWYSLAMHIMSSDTNLINLKMSSDQCFAAAQHKRCAARKLRQEADDLEVAAARDDQNGRTYLQQASEVAVTIGKMAVTKVEQGIQLRPLPNPAAHCQDYRRRPHVGRAMSLTPAAQSSSARPAASQSSSAIPLARLTLRSRSPQSRASRFLKNIHEEDL